MHLEAVHEYRGAIKSWHRRMKKTSLEKTQYFERVSRWAHF